MPPDTISHPESEAVGQDFLLFMHELRTRDNAGTVDLLTQFEEENKRLKAEVATLRTAVLALLDAEQIRANAMAMLRSWERG